MVELSFLERRKKKRRDEGLPGKVLKSPLEKRKKGKDDDSPLHLVIIIDGYKRELTYVKESVLSAQGWEFKTTSGSYFLDPQQRIHLFVKGYPEEINDLKIVEDSRKGKKYTVHYSNLTKMMMNMSFVRKLFGEPIELDVIEEEFKRIRKTILGLLVILMVVVGVMIYLNFMSMNKVQHDLDSLKQIIVLMGQGKGG